MGQFCPAKPELTIPISVVDKPVIKHPVDFVTPKSDQLVGISEVSTGNETHSLDDLGEVTQVEHVVTLSRSRKKRGQNGLEINWVTWII